jgi:hypothetical protein
MINGHPSYLELDRLHARGGDDGGAPLREHVAACADCRAYLDALAASAASPAPRWLDEIALRKSWTRRARIFLSRPRVAIPSLASLGAAAALLILLAQRSGPPSTLDGDTHSMISIKGEPGVWIHIRRNEAVFVWDGHALLHAGDRLRLELEGAGHSYFAVATQAGDSIALLQAGSLPARGHLLLPQGLEVDAAPGREVLYVVLGPHLIADGREVAAALKGDSSGAIWARALIMEKASTPDEDRSGRAPR